MHATDQQVRCVQLAGGRLCARRVAMERTLAWPMTSSPERPDSLVRMASAIPVARYAAVESPTFSNGAPRVGWGR